MSYKKYVSLNYTSMLCGVACIVFCVVGFSIAFAADNKPNVVLLVADDLGYGGTDDDGSGAEDDEIGEEDREQVAVFGVEEIAVLSRLPNLPRTQCHLSPLLGDDRAVYDSEQRFDRRESIRPSKWWIGLQI